MSETLYLKTLSDAALELKEIPLFGSPPPFPYEDLEKAVARVLEIDPVHIKVKQGSFLEPDELLEGLGANPSITPLTLTPLPGNLLLAMPAKNVSKFSTPFSDTTLKEGFWTYTLLQLLEAFNQLNSYGNLQLAMGEDPTLPEEGALAIEVDVTLGAEKLHARVVFPKEFRASFHSHFHMEAPPLLTDPNFSDLMLPLTLEVGSTTLSAELWSEVEVGDFLLLDRCTFHPANGRGTAILSLGETPLFDVRIKEGECKILEYALIHEAPMTTEHPEETPKEESSAKEPLTLSGKIPLEIKAEIGRIQMPLEKVTQLTPGNVLELGMNKSPDVHLTVGGKRIAKGELVNLGEALGIKILKVGE